MKCLAFLFQAAGTQTWVPEKDCLVNYVVGTANGVTVSTDPSIVGTDLIGPLANKILYDIISYASAGTAAASQKPGGELKIPVSAGQKVFVNALAQGTILVYYDDVIS
jgi:hypothetical protein